MLKTNEVLTKTAKIIRKIVVSKKFVVAIFALFFLQGVFFVIAIRPGLTSNDLKVVDIGVAPDEVRHFNNIKYYAEKPISEGPFIEKLHDEELVLGDAQRFPSYLYYYLMSFIARGVYLFSSNDFLIIFILRFSTLITGALTIVVFRKLLKELTRSEGIVNLTTLALVNTGMFIWLSAAVNYDIPSLGMFFLLLLFCVRAFKDSKNLLYATPLLLLIGLIKYTYIPFAFFSFGLVVLLKISKLGIKEFINDSVSTIARIKKAQIILLVFLTILFGGLFTERIVGNLVKYHAINPTCEKVHTVAACQNFEIFERNNRVKNAYSDGIEQDLIDPYRYSPGHIGLWVDSYFISTYTYRSHVKNMKGISYVLVFLFMSISAILVTMISRKRFRVATTIKQYFIFIVVGVYLLGTYIFNVATLYEFGRVFAYQGRYILLSTAFLYLYLTLLIVSFNKNNKSMADRIILLCLLVLLLLWAVFSNPTVSFLMHSENLIWYTNSAIELFPDSILNGL